MTTQPGERRRSPWLGVQGISALLVLVVTAGWRGTLLAGSFFNQDDYYLTSRAFAETTWSWSYLMEPVAGHVMPLQHATYWLVAHHLPFDWPTLSLLILLMQLASGVVAWHLLSLLLPDRWARVPLLALLMWAPLTLVTTLWWSASMGLWPHVLMALIASVAMVRARLGIGATWFNLLTCVLATVVGLGWHERSVLIAPLLVGIAVSMSPTTGWRRLVETLRRFWILWATFALGMIGYLRLHSALTSVEAGSASLRQYLDLSGVYIFENAIPGMVGGPWVADIRGGAVIPPTWVSVVSGLLVLSIIVVLLVRGTADARWALLLLVGYVMADLALVLAGRVGFGWILGYDPRYSADLVLPAVIAAALALRHRRPRMPRGESRWGLRRLHLRTRGWGLGGATGALIVTALVGVASVIGTAPLVPHFQNVDDREYWDNVRLGLAVDPSQVLLDQQVPADILLPLLEEESLSSSVFAPLPETPVFDQPAPRLRRISSTGELEAIDLILTSDMREGKDPGCGYAVRDRSRRVPLNGSVSGPFVARISYFTDASVDMIVSVGNFEGRFRTLPGPNDVWIVVPDQGTMSALHFEQEDLDSTATVCIAGLFAGIAAES